MREYIDREALVIDLDRRHDFLEERHGGCDSYTMGFLEAVLRVENFWPTDAVSVVRCKDCAVPHDKYTGCPELNGLIPQPDFYCAAGKLMGCLRGVE